MRRALLVLALAASTRFGLDVSPSTPAQPSAPDTPCGASGAAPRPSRDLYCIELDPVPALEGITATFELNRIPSPFGVNVTRDGRQVYALVLRVTGLPATSAFSGGARVWIAWMATQQLHPTRKLGVVGNGRHALPVIDWPKFLILVTAESSADVANPDGRVALRGFSPSSRMQPPDLSEFLYGAAPVTDPAAPRPSAAGPDHALHAGELPVGGGTSWIHPPILPGLAMMPAEMRFPFPAATPFLPSEARGAPVPDAKPREVVRLHDGDTLLLTATPVRQTVRGHPFIGYGYNGQVPGPMIWTTQGSTLKVRYRNRIEWPSTVHWHGVRLDNRFDGAEGLTQDAVPPGGDFDYTVHLPDAGRFWYHPRRRDHILRDLGLYGNLLVTPSHEELGPANREEVLMLDDLELADQGLVPYGRERTTHALMGRFGNVMLLNGRTDWSLDVPRGEVVRFLLTNVSNARTFNLSFGGARIKLLGSDLSNFEHEEWVESVVVAPAERYLVDVRFAVPGTIAIENRVLAIDHIFGRIFPQVDTPGTVRVKDQAARPDYGAAFADTREHRGVIADIDRVRNAFDRPPDRSLVVRMEAKGLPFVVERFLRIDSVYFHPVEWSGTMPMMNWNSTSTEVQWIRARSRRWPPRCARTISARGSRSTAPGSPVLPSRYSGMGWRTSGRSSCR